MSRRNPNRRAPRQDWDELMHQFRIGEALLSAIRERIPDLERKPDKTLIIRSRAAVRLRHDLQRVIVHLELLRQEVAEATAMQEPQKDKRK